MKWLIASDLHGSLRYCRELLQAFSRERAERLLLLGDLLYHGPRNDLPDQYAPKEVIPLLNERKAEILCVPCREEGVNADDWHRTEAGRQRVLGELRRLGDQINVQLEELIAHAGE